MPLTLYLRRDSFVHSLHPVTKVLFLAVVFLAGLLVTHPLPTLVLGLFVAAGVVLARAAATFGKLWLFWTLLFLVTTIIWTYAYPGAGEVVRIGPIPLPLRGALFGLAMGTRLGVFLAAGMLVLVTTRVEAIAAALRRLGLPFTAGFVLTLAFRLVPVFAGTAGTVIAAHAARGYDLDRGTPWARLRRHGRLIVPIFLCGLRNADGMALALESRGFAPGGPGPHRRSLRRRPDLDVRPFTWRDGLAGLALMALLGVVVALRVAGLGAI
jgi:energy-coupling factor transport system permease protein